MPIRPRPVTKFYGVFCKKLNIFTTKLSGNVYLYLAFLAQNGKGTARERSRNDQKFFGNGQGMVTNKKVTERERYRNERITVNENIFSIYI